MKGHLKYAGQAFLPDLDLVEYFVHIIHTSRRRLFLQGGLLKNYFCNLFPPSHTFSPFLLDTQFSLTTNHDVSCYIIASSPSIIFNYFRMQKRIFYFESWYSVQRTHNGLVLAGLGLTGPSITGANERYLGVKRVHHIKVVL
jgi:hypothetical protein